MNIIQAILGDNIGASLLIIINLIIIEGLLSIDNAAVLATMAMNLPENQRKRALRIGLFIGYIFRGLCLIFASVLIKIWWLKVIGGLYLVYLCFHYFYTRTTESKEDDDLIDDSNWLYKMIVSRIGVFWATVLSIETMDLIFSIDNVFAAVAFTDNIYLVCLGVFIGILCMRFVAGHFLILMGKYPYLSTSAFIVVGILGIKLCLDVPCHFMKLDGYCSFIENETFDLIVSLSTVFIFIAPIIYKRLTD